MAGDKNNTQLNIVSFVIDENSKLVIDTAIKELNLPYTESYIGGISQARDYLKNRNTPKVVLVDISESELPLTDLTTITEVCSPDVRMIVVGSQNNVSIFRELLRFGCYDYLHKTLTVDVVKKSISNANAGTDQYDASDARTGKFITFLGANGGIGTTTLATNCAWLLANKFFKKTVIVDTDFQFGDANMFLDLQTETSYLDYLESPEKVDDYFIETTLQSYNQKLFYLGGLTDILRKVENDTASFSVVLDVIKKQFNYIICDTPKHLDDLTRIVLQKTSCFVLVVEFSMSSAQHASRILELIRSEARDSKVIVVANNVGKYDYGAIVRSDFEKIINTNVRHMIPFNSSSYLAAVNVGRPIVATFEKSSSHYEEILDDIFGGVSIQTDGLGMDGSLSHLEKIAKLFKKFTSNK